MPELRKHIGTTAFVEGWALYAESLGPDHVLEVQVKAWVEERKAAGAAEAPAP